MMSYWQLLLLVLPVFAVIAIGVVVRRVHWVEGEAETSLMRLVVNVCSPCFVFESVASNAALRVPENLLLPPLVGFVMTVVGIRAGLLVAKWIGLQVGTGMRTFALAVGVTNYGYLPLPIMAGLWGPESRGVLLVHNVGVEIAIWTVGVLVLSGLSFREGWRKLVSPMLIALALAVACNLGGVTPLLPKLVMETIHTGREFSELPQHAGRAIRREGDGCGDGFAVGCAPGGDAGCGKISAVLDRVEAGDAGAGGDAGGLGFDHHCAGLWRASAHGGADRARDDGSRGVRDSTVVAGWARVDRRVSRARKLYARSD